MKTPSPKIDWHALRGALIILLLSVLFGAGLIVANLQYRKYQDTLERGHRNALREIQAEYGKVQEALELVGKGYYETFNKLTEQSFFQEKPALTMEEQRLQMVSEIKAIISKLPKFPTPTSYELAEQTLYTVPDISVEPQLKTYETKLILKMGLLHEEDMLKLITAIEFQQLPGLFNLQKCELKRIQETIDVKNVSRAYIEASCVLAWYTSTIQMEETE